MTNKEYGIIMGYFDRKHVNREELEKSCDFDNLTMTILKLLLAKETFQ